MSIVVAIDGPAGSGKSSVSKAVARKLSYSYLDTGAAYRVLTWACVDAGVDLSDEDAVVDILQSMDYQAPLDPDRQHFTVGGADISELIRSESTSSHVSAVARHPKVRQELNRGFRDLADNAPQGIIIEGRDITTVVAPDAPVRVLLTADEDVRIARRQAELSGVDASALTERDRADRQVVDFMTAADGVATIDCTHLSFHATVDALSALIEPVVQGKAI